MSVDLVQVLVQVPALAVFVLFAVKLIRMFQDRDAVRDKARAEERKEMQQVVVNNTEALRGVTAAVGSQSTCMQGIQESMEEMRSRLALHDEFVRGKLD
jgi:hypothetical protein